MDETGGIVAPDITLFDVGSSDIVCITWMPDGVTLHSITGLPPSVRLSGPDALGRIKGTYFAPEEDVTFDYLINATVDGHRVWHDPKIHNTTPTMPKRRTAKSKAKPKSAKAVKAAKPAKKAKARGRK
jgi:hypothetical protein